MDYFGKLLRKSRKSAGLTQKELAEKVAIDASSVSKMESGVFLPVRKVAEGIADTLGMTKGPLTLYVATKYKAVLERFIFFLAASVAGTEDVQEIKLVEVEDDKLGQVITQGSPAQQLPSAADGESSDLQQILTQLKELTSTVAQLQAEGAEVKAIVKRLHHILLTAITQQDLEEEGEKPSDKQTRSLLYDVLVDPTLNLGPLKELAKLHQVGMYISPLAKEETPPQDASCQNQK